MLFTTVRARLGNTARTWRTPLTLGIAAALAPFLLACGASQPAPSGPAVAEPGTSPAAVSPPPVDGSPPAGATLSPSQTASVPATPRPTSPPLPRVPPLQPPAHASRVVVPDFGIDLPVISGDLQPPPSYPLCDVAAYVTRFNQPYETGITYISAHAQKGMFLPLLEASFRADGQELLGSTVDVYTDDGVRYRYTIERVVRHATDYAILAEIPLDARTLILQTSEGPYGTVEKLQVVASFQEEQPVDLAEATPQASPRDCRPAEPVPSTSP